MTTYKISPSMLEKWRTTRLGLYRQTSQGFLESLRIKQPTTRPQSRGTAYHRILEEGADKFAFQIGKETYYKVPCPILKIDWVFSEKAVLPARNLNVAIQGKRGIFETKHCHQIAMPGFNIEMNMRLDLLVGYTLHEFKTTARPPVFQAYEDSLQWKCYLLAFPELTAAKYHFFHLNDDNSQCYYSHFTLPRALSMEDEVMSEVNDLVTFLKQWPEYLQLLEVKPKVINTGIEDL